MLTKFLKKLKPDSSMQNTRHFRFMIRHPIFSNISLTETETSEQYTVKHNCRRDWVYINFKWQLIYVALLLKIQIAQTMGTYLPLYGLSPNIYTAFPEYWFFTFCSLQCYATATCYIQINMYGFKEVGFLKKWNIKEISRASWSIYWWSLPLISCTARGARLECSLVLGSIQLNPSHCIVKGGYW